MNFPLILLVITIITGILWVIDLCVWKKQRHAAAEEAGRAFDQAHSGEEQTADLAERRRAVVQDKKRMPAWLDWTAGLFPIILLVFVIRSFVVEPFRIPSGSMLPTLESGDFIAVNKYVYGVRFPVINAKLTEGRKPVAGDVIVFDHPLEHGTDLIKRVVGVPGDKIVYKNKILYINGKVQPQTAVGDFIDEEAHVTLDEKKEVLEGHPHRMATDHRAPDATYAMGPTTHPGLITYTDTGFETTVPKGHYFVMGDNRDNSADSRYWGFVPEDGIVGRAFFIWLNIPKMSRIGSFE